MRSTDEIKKEIEYYKGIEKSSDFREDERAGVQEEIVELEKELAISVLEESKIPVVKKEKKVTPPKEKQYIIFNGEKIYSTEGRYNAHLKQLWDERKAKMDSLGGKMKTESIVHTE